MQDQRTHLVTGATGYVGGRLIERLLEKGERVRALVRRPSRLEQEYAGRIEVVRADLSDADSLGTALSGIDVAYYLVHSMGAGGDFEGRDREAARNFARVARECGVQRIVYLGGLGEAGSDLSPHLRSRHEVGRILRDSGVQVLELRASIVLGSGSLSFELVRALVERLPVMVTPRWVDVLAQPIGVRDLLSYLVAGAEVPLSESCVVEIGGARSTSYGELLREYARQRGLRRWMIRVPVLTPRLSGWWLGLVTPVYARVGQALVESIKHPTVVRDPSARRLFPQIEPMEPAEAMRRALLREDSEVAHTRWCDALSSGSQPKSWGGARFKSRLIDSREAEVDAPAELAFRPVRRIGGKTGWYAYSWLWRVRGFLDLLVGGVGVRRGRRDPEQLAVGDALDFWRVEAVDAGRLRLRAEMKVPGRAWLEFEVEPLGPNRSRLRQTAEFDPLGLFGLAYWYALWPLHVVVFRGMLRAIVAAAERES